MYDDGVGSVDTRESHLYMCAEFDHRAHAAVPRNGPSINVPFGRKGLCTPRPLTAPPRVP